MMIVRVSSQPVFLGEQIDSCNCLAKGRGVLIRHIVNKTLSLSRTYHPPLSYLQICSREIKKQLTLESPHVSQSIFPWSVGTRATRSQQPSIHWGLHDPPATQLDGSTSCKNRGSCGFRSENIGGIVIHDLVVGRWPRSSGSDPPPESGPEVMAVCLPFENRQ